MPRGKKQQNKGKKPPQKNEPKRGHSSWIENEANMNRRVKEEHKKMLEEIRKTTTKPANYRKRLHPLASAVAKSKKPVQTKRGYHKGFRVSDLNMFGLKRASEMGLGKINFH